MRRFHKYTDDCETYEWIHHFGNRCYYIIQLRLLPQDGDACETWWWGWYRVDLDYLDRPVLGLDDETAAGFAFEGDNGVDCLQTGYGDTAMDALMEAFLAAQH